MLATHSSLRNPHPRADHPLTATVKRVGNYAVTIAPHGGALTTIGGKIQHFSCFEMAEEFLGLYQQGNHDRAIPFACPGISLIVHGSLVCRAPEWVQREAEDLELGERSYVWYFVFAREKDDTAHVLADKYDSAMIELAELIRAETYEDLNSLPF
jgi:hypothetical protein